MPKIMGILNVTPDSFSDGGQHFQAQTAIERGLEMQQEGATIIDVGGESTRPGADRVSEQEEIERVIPVIEGLNSALSPDVEISIDTSHEAVAMAAVAAGARIINDVSAGLGQLAGDLRVGWIAMHRQGTPTSMQDDPYYEDVVAEVLEFLTIRATAARRSGCERVWIDPGFGFGKTLEHNLDLLAHLDRFVNTDFDVAIGVSRKSMIGSLIASSDGVDEVEVDDRLAGSLAAATWAMHMGADIVRVHDVAPTVQAAKVVAGTVPDEVAA